jgi:hypothetical protein
MGQGLIARVSVSSSVPESLENAVFRAVLAFFGLLTIRPELWDQRNRAAIASSN